MAESTEQPRRKLIIKLYLPASEKREEGVCEKPKPKCSTDYSSRVISKVCELKNKKGYYAATIWVNAENPSSSSSSRSECNEKEDVGNVNKREFKNEKECVFKGNTNKRERLHSEKKNKKESVCKRNKSHIVMMDQCKKKQCWVILKRLMVGRDAWALKQPLLDNKSRSRKAKILMGLEDIECNLQKFKYSKVEEFADDIRLVFSYALQYPLRSEVHKTARRMKDTFELTWKNFNHKWVLHQD
ncbi:bromodomain-containing factor 2 [Cajanus cajan]|nr:bromodomain-containing factor 2 [Cajanus cajan]